MWAYINILEVPKENFYDCIFLPVFNLSFNIGAQFSISPGLMELKLTKSILLQTRKKLPKYKTALK